MEKKFWKLVDSSDNIAITSHYAPDPDAICSMLLLGKTLQTNYKNKLVNMVLEEKITEELTFLNGYDKIIYGNLYENLTQFKPTLLIIVDTNKFERCSRNHWQDAKKYVIANRVDVAIIDHHQPHDRFNPAIYINHQAPAATQEIYSLCFEGNRLKKPVGYEDISLLGIVSDTGGFKYANKLHRQTFKIVSDLIDNGASIEKLENRMTNLSIDQIELLSHIMANTVLANGYTYSFIKDSVAGQWIKSQKPINDFNIACKVFINQYLRNIGQNDWGFVVYQDFVGGKDHYSVSFRSVDGSQDVSKISRPLGGGGHKQAAGIKLKAENVQKVIKKVINAIDQN